MERIKLTYTISRKAALLAGKSYFGEVTIEPTEEELASLTVAERAYLANNVTTIDRVCDSTGRLSFVDHDEHELSFEAAYRILTASMQCLAACEAKIKEENAATEARLHIEALEWTAKPMDEKICRVNTWDHWVIRMSDLSILRKHSPEALAEAEAECARRKASDKAEREATEAAKEAKKAAQECEQKKAIDEWLAIYGNRDLLHQRYVEGYLPETELWQAITDQVMDPYGTWPTFSKMQPTDVCTHCSPSFTVYDAPVLDAIIYAKLFEFRKRMPEADFFSVREHIGVCEENCDCETVVKRYGVRVCVNWHGRKLCREFALDWQSGAKATS